LGRNAHASLHAAVERPGVIRVGDASEIVSA
jgi:hypothetical protein